MPNVISVNAAIAGLQELAGTGVCVEGVLNLEFEGQELIHFPKSERDQTRCYGSRIWIGEGSGSISLNRNVLERWSGRRVVASGILLGATERMGFGHMGLWPAELLVRAIERL